MRQIISALLLGFAGYGATLLLERYVTAVPEWSWRLLGIACVLAGLVGAALSDTGFMYLRNARTSVLYAFFGGIFAVLGIAVFGLVVRPLLVASDHQTATPEIAKAVLEWRNDNRVPRLNVALISKSTDTIRDVRLFVTDIRKQSATGAFVEVPFFHQDGPFIETELGFGGFSSPVLFPDVPLVAPFLTLNDDGRLWFARIEDDKDASAVLHMIPIPEPGVWRVTFRTSGGVRLADDSRQLFFEWTAGNLPVPWQQ